MDNDNSKKDIAKWYQELVDSVYQKSKEISKDVTRFSQLTDRSKTVAVVSDGSEVTPSGEIVGPYGILPVLEGVSKVIDDITDLKAVPISVDTSSLDTLAATLIEISANFGLIYLNYMDLDVSIELKDILSEYIRTVVVDEDLVCFPIIILANIINSIRLLKKELEDIKVVINGGGLLSRTIVELLISAGVKHLRMVDENGIQCPSDENLDRASRIMAGTINPELETGDLKKALENSDIYINIENCQEFKRSYIREMTDKSVVIDIYHVGEYYDILEEYNDATVLSTRLKGQYNRIDTALVYPGLLEGLSKTSVETINTEIMLRTGKAIADYVAEEELSIDNILPRTLSHEFIEYVAEGLEIL